MPRHPLLLLIALAFASGCDQPQPTAPVESAPRTEPSLGTSVGNPQYLYSNGPITPNVFRTAEAFVFGLPDFETGLHAWVGFPDDPTDAVDCGGDSDYPLVPLQAAGWQQAFNLLAVSGEINIHVYDLNNFEDTCFSPVIAAGTGHAVYTDNDVLNTGPGTNAFGLNIGGILTTVPGGEPVRVQGTVRSLSLPDGSFRTVVSHLSLTPVGGQ
jgi:hypothetical protein